MYIFSTFTFNLIKNFCLKCSHTIRYGIIVCDGNLICSHTLIYIGHKLSVLTNKYHFMSHKQPLFEEGLGVRNNNVFLLPLPSCTLSFYQIDYKKPTIETGSGKQYLFLLCWQSSKLVNEVKCV